ncbi:MAG: hypothetical protein ACRDHK_00860 [Actinomycetota bacterium]
MTARRGASAVIALVALFALVGAGCSKKIVNQLIPNQPPEVRLTAAPVTHDSLRPDFYAYTMQWVGYDPDGRVDHFLIAVDPVRSDTILPSDTTWHVTASNESTFFFQAGQNYDPIDRSDARSQSPHVIAVFAVDNEGMRSSRPATRAFFSFTQCPIVNITDPTPSTDYQPNVTPTVTFQWTGSDQDGQFSIKPIRWVYRLFSQSNPDRPNIPNYISYARQYPDSIRRYYAPEFPGWSSVGAETTSVQFRSLNPGSTYLFVVNGFDEAGAYDPVFQNGRTMLIFGVTFAGTSGPVIRMFNQFFDYTYSTGGYDPSESKWFKLEVPADQPLTFNWSATPPLGANMRRYRWVMDLEDLTDQTPRSNETTDYYHWSSWSLNTTSATLIPFLRHGDEHLFFIEAEDSNGLVSLGIIFFTVIRSTFEKSLLIVDDTRLRTDRRLSATSSALAPPVGVWPTAAELDTFLFAKGGFPYRFYPPGSVSSPGIFNGYSYDTIGTRGISLDGTVPLSFIGRYKHVIWYTDELGATYVGSPFDRNTPITALRLVSSPSRPAILSTYMTQGYRTQGGKVWLCGGGAAYATLNPWNKPGTPTNEYTNVEPNPELRPGRLMYDFTHWRESIFMNPANEARKFGSFDLPQPAAGLGSNRPGRHWPPNPPLPTPPGPPDYTLLPATLQPKTLDDPLPPQRSYDANFLRNIYRAEFISILTHVREDYDDDPEIVREYATLDTLYMTLGATALQNMPVMTYYHGRENQPLVFSGFNIWYWRRGQCIQLVDWVLQSVWGLSRDAGASRATSVPPRAAVTLASPSTRPRPSPGARQATR